MRIWRQSTENACVYEYWRSVVICIKHAKTHSTHRPPVRVNTVIFRSLNTSCRWLLNLKTCGLSVEVIANREISSMDLKWNLFPWRDFRTDFCCNMVHLPAWCTCVCSIHYVSIYAYRLRIFIHTCMHIERRWCACKHTWRNLSIHMCMHTYRYWCWCKYILLCRYTSMCLVDVCIYARMGTCKCICLCKCISV